MDFVDKKRKRMKKKYNRKYKCSIALYHSNSEFETITSKATRLINEDESEFLPYSFYDN